MKKLLLLFGVVLTIALFPNFAFADTASQLTGGIRSGDFVLNDLSFRYLQDIFGVVDGVLHGSGSQILGRMFGVLNSAVLALGFMILAYILFVSTLNTAHQGEILGKNWSSIWIPLRTVISVGLLVPKATGYSAIQIFMMWIVLQGILAADAVMLSALNYIKQGGVIIQSSPPPDVGIVKTAADIFKVETCMYGVNNSLTVQYGAQTSIPTFAPDPVNITLTQSSKNNPVTPIVYFPAINTPPMSNYPTVNLGGVCGSVSWNAKTYSAPDAGISVSTSSNSTADAYTDYRGVAVQQVILDLLPLAQQVANTLVTPQPGVSYGKVEDVLNANINSIIFSAADYKGIMLPILRDNKKEEDAKSQHKLNKIFGQGWVTLGSIYYILARANNNVNANEDDAPKVVFEPGAINNTSSAWNMVGKDQNTLFCQEASSSSGCAVDVLTSNMAADADMPQGSKNGKIDSDTNNYIDHYIAQSWKNTDANGTYKSQDKDKWGNKKGVLNKILNAMLGPIYTITNSLDSLAQAEKYNIDPIFTVMQLGNSLVKLATQLWLGMTGTIFILISVAGSCAAVNSLGLGVLGVIVWLLPMMSVILLALFVTGSMMAFYVPLIPFILFTFGAIGWFAAVMETMIAAPLVALGIAIPEGHDVFGKSVSAIMLITNVFIRPTLMVFGFFAGVILSHVGLWLLNKGFILASAESLFSDVSSLGILGFLWGILACIIIYITLVLTVINQTFGLIHQLPDQIMRWLGGSGMQTLGASPSEAVNAAKSGIESGSKPVGEVAQKAGEGLVKKAGEKGVKNEGGTGTAS